MHKYLHLVYSGSCSTLPLVSQTQNCTIRLGVILHNDRICISNSCPSVNTNLLRVQVSITLSISCRCKSSNVVALLKVVIV